MPWVKEADHKIKKYYQSFDYLFELTSDFDVQVFDRIGRAQSFNLNNVVFNYFHSFTSSKVLLPFKLILKLRKWNPDVVLVQGLGFPHGLIFFKLFLNSSVKFIVRDHADKLPIKILRPLYKWADLYTDVYFFTSKKMGHDWVAKGIMGSENKIEECVEGSTRFRHNSDIVKKTNSFLWVGRLDENKDPLTILHAFFGLTKKDKNVTLKMIFEDDSLLSQVRNLIEENSLDEYVKLVGKVEHEDIEEYYQESMFFILGSYKEGGPFSLIEAMACGCIPIVTDIPAFRNMLDKGRLGFLFEPGNEEQLEHILLNLDKQNLELLRKSILVWFESELSNKAIAKKTRNLITELFNHP